MVIYKYPLEFGAVNILGFPERFKPVYVGEQEGQIYLWVQLEQSDPQTQIRAYRIVGTGWEMEDSSIHIGTVQIGKYVWHVMDVSEKGF